MNNDDGTVTFAVESAATALLDLAHRDASLATRLARLVGVIASEAAENNRLAHSLTNALDTASDITDTPHAARSRTTDKPSRTHTRRTRSNRRNPGPWDPFAVFNEVGADGLRERLLKLDLEQLRDIIAEHGMDADKLAMKWKDTSRVADRIVERVMSRSEKGSAFRGTE
ncbi:hypothetical protein [Lentzea sp. NPDC004782]|uniref:hypothetical protein n=1 Tax=Lentzea sp. NPDC004782 TaxID=3154458 RepID=UPI0033A20EFD